MKRIMPEQLGNKLSLRQDLCHGKHERMCWTCAANVANHFCNVFLRYVSIRFEMMIYFGNPPRTEEDGCKHWPIQKEIWKTLHGETYTRAYGRKFVWSDRLSMDMASKERELRTPGARDQVPFYVEAQEIQYHGAVMVVQK